MFMLFFESNISSLCKKLFCCIFHYIKEIVFYIVTFEFIERIIVNMERELNLQILTNFTLSAFSLIWRKSHFFP